MRMKKPPKTDLPIDLDADWKCEHCGKVVKFGDTHLSWCLNIICEECAEKERESETTP
jgi:hypothetical protein